MLSVQDLIDQRYRVLSVLGSGGMGDVYLVENLPVGRREALKVLKRKWAANRELASRFRREVKALQRLRHPNIIEVFDAGELAGGGRYLTMEHVPGRSLAAILDDGELALPRIDRILFQLACALEHAHGAGVIHRDLKPQNLMIDERRDDLVKVLDFGVAKIVAPDYQESAVLSTDAEFWGSLPYLAPEQIDGTAPDPRSDIYAVGILAFEMITGAVPFRGNQVQVMRAHRLEVPEPPSARRPEARRLDDIVLACLEKAPERRLDSSQLVVALRSGQLRRDDNDDNDDTDEVDAGETAPLRRPGRTRPPGSGQSTG